MTKDPWFGSHPPNTIFLLFCKCVKRRKIGQKVANGCFKMPSSKDTTLVNDKSVRNKKGENKLDNKFLLKYPRPV